MRDVIKPVDCQPLAECGVDLYGFAHEKRVPTLTEGQTRWRFTSPR